MNDSIAKLDQKLHTDPFKYAKYKKDPVSQLPGPIANNSYFVLKAKLYQVKAFNMDGTVSYNK